MRRIRFTASRRVLLAVLCLAVAVLLNVPYAAPGYGSARDAIVLSLAVIGILLTVPSAWRVGRRFTAPWARRVVGTLAAGAWLVTLGYAMAVTLFLTQSPGFMQSRELKAIIRSHDGRVTFHLYQWTFLLDSFGDPELAMPWGPFEIGLVKGDRRHLDDFNRRTRDVRALGHRLELDGDTARIDGQPARIEYVGTQG